MVHTQRLSMVVALGLSALLWAACSTAQPSADPSGPPAPHGDEAPAEGVEGATLAASGAGAALGEACGSAHGACGDDGFCLFPADGACGDGGVSGVCTARPRGCKRDCPGVCGCEGEFYCNACVAHAQGRAVRHKGRCEAPPDEPACDPDDAECDAGETCTSETGKVIPCE